ncbi:MAG: c-type cytochrome [Alphaproteobacteria bacterium]|nr:c-type cytochrome [Alphaproteobacteria bacterium]
MRRALLFAAALFAVSASRVAVGSDPQDFAQIERGRYLTIVGDCAACHTATSGADFAGGRAIETPFGTIVSTNITPDRETGIGDWSNDQFVSALTEGIRRDGAHLYPAMPYPYLTKITRDDALAIRAYLTTVPAVSNAVTADRLPFPLSIRADMAAWNKLYFTPGAFQPNSGKSDEWNRGSYLVEGLMHCGACHTPKNTAGADKDSERLQGGVIQGWFAPNITNDQRRGLGRWSLDDIVTYLKTGHNAFSAATGPMAEEIAESSSKMTEADLHAVAIYLKDQPSADNHSPVPLPAGDPAMQTGAAIYADECSGCHTPRGSGIAGLFPRLAGSPSVQSDDPTSLIRIVINGTRSVSTPAAPTGPGMPAFGWLLNDGEVASVLTYIRNNWGNAATSIAAERVTSQRKALVRTSE